MFSSEVSRARKKIVDAFPTAERKRIAPLRQRIFVGRPASATVRGTYSTPESTVMRQLQVAFVREAIVRAEVEEGTSFRARPLEIATAILGAHCDQAPLNQI